MLEIEGKNSITSQDTPLHLIDHCSGVKCHPFVPFDPPAPPAPGPEGPQSPPPSAAPPPDAPWAGPAKPGGLPFTAWAVRRSRRVYAGLQVDMLGPQLVDYEAACSFRVGTAASNSSAAEAALVLRDRGTTLAASYFQHLIVKRRVMNILAPEHHVGITNYIDVGFEVQVGACPARVRGAAGVGVPSGLGCVGRLVLPGVRTCSPFEEGILRVAKPNSRGIFLVGESGTVVPLLTSTTAARDALEGGQGPPPPPPPCRAPSYGPTTVSLTATASFNGICNQQQPLPTALATSSNRQASVPKASRVVF